MNYFHFFVYTLLTFISFYVSFLNFKSFSHYIQKKWNILLIWNLEFYIIRLINKFFNYIFLGNILAIERQKAREELIHQLMNLLILIFLITSLNINEVICWICIFTPLIYESIRIKIIKERIYLFNNFRMERKQRIKLLSYVFFTLIECVINLKIIYNLFYNLKSSIKVIILFEPIIICINCLFLIIISSYHYFNSKIFYEKPTYFYFLLSLNNIICNLIQMFEYIYMWFFYGSFLNFIDFFLLLKLKNCLICLKNNYKSTKNCFINEKLFNNYFKNEDKKYLKLNNIICIICRDYNYHINYKKLTCGHSFHISCLYLLFEYDKSFLCPICRREIKYELEDFEKNYDNLNSNSINCNTVNTSKEEDTNENKNHIEKSVNNSICESSNDHVNPISHNQENYDNINIYNANKSNNINDDNCNNEIYNVNRHNLTIKGDKKNLNNEYNKSIIKFEKVSVSNIYFNVYNEIYDHYNKNKINYNDIIVYNYNNDKYMNYNNNINTVYINKIYNNCVNKSNYSNRYNSFSLSQPNYKNDNILSITNIDSNITLLSNVKNNITSSNFSRIKNIDDKYYERVIKDNISLLKQVNISFNNILKSKNEYFFTNVKRCYNKKYEHEYLGIENKIFNIEKYDFKKYITISNNVKNKNIFSYNQYKIKDKEYELNHKCEIQNNIMKNKSDKLEENNYNKLEHNKNYDDAKEDKHESIENEKTNKFKFIRKFNLFKRSKDKNTTFVNHMNSKKRSYKLNVYDFFKNLKEKIRSRTEINLNDTNKKNKTLFFKKKN
ncbi:zinc finger protein, putative [Plasmodium gallinaceum]|uniref:Zinc finger protein, putative n=1 Tax=Plasmodium gallinaceum TaxID=5849 RepID=A0A1J1GSJ5_PLAGA|nr:zinc finger protein, putative [Plasmodium gallinaceum]CRG95404.1 zinc finger protein, putative [Plasmodium gallinaceum]